MKINIYCIRNSFIINVKLYSIKSFEKNLSKLEISAYDLDVFNKMSKYL